MGYTTYCNPYDRERGYGEVEVSGVEVGGKPKETKAKVVEPEKKASPKKSVATTKVVKAS